MRGDTYLGMAFSNVIAFFIILDTGAVLHAHGITDIQTGAQAAEALRPLAGELAFVLFSLGIIGTGLIAIPVLAGSSAYALAEALEWPIGLDRKLHNAKGFYGILGGATLLGIGLNFYRSQSDQGAFLERRDQRRGCRADHDCDDADDDQ
jgi:Mn2+/Fe2+ NRAMP family transporter